MKTKISPLSNEVIASIFGSSQICWFPWLLVGVAKVVAVLLVVVVIGLGVVVGLGVGGMVDGGRVCDSGIDEISGWRAPYIS